MGTPILLLDTQVQMQATLGTDKTITAITKATEASVTATHDFVVGDIVVFAADVGGMAEMNNRIARVKSVSTTVSFVCEGLDSTDFATFTSGGTVRKVATWHTFDNLTGFSFPEPQPNRIDVTTIHLTEKREIFGLDDAPQITMPLISDPGGTVTAAVRVASKTKTLRAFRVTLQTGAVLLLNAYVAGGRGFDGSGPGVVGTGEISLTLAADEQWYAS